MRLLLVADNDMPGIADAKRCWETTYPYAIVHVLTPATLTDGLVSLTPTDLVVHGQPWPMEDAVALCLGEYFGPDQLRGMALRDRAYSAAELTAIVSGLLDRFDIPVLNRPTGAFLAGRGWRRNQWLTLASAYGLAVTRADSAEAVVVQVVSPSCLVTRGPARALPVSVTSVLRRLTAAAGLRAAWFQLNNDGFDRFYLIDAGVGPRLDLCQSTSVRCRLLQLSYNALTTARHPLDPAIA